MRSPAAPHRASSVSAGPEVFLPSRRSGAGVRWSGGRRRAAPQPNLRRWRTRRTWVLIPGKPARPAVCRTPPSRLASRSQRWLLVLMAGHPILARSCPHLGTTVKDRTTSQPEIRQNPRSEVPSEELHPFSFDLETVSGFEPLACRLQEVRPPAPGALAAPMTRIVALTALTALRLSGAPFHEPFHARGPHVGHPVTVRNIVLGFVTRRPGGDSARRRGGPVSRRTCGSVPLATEEPLAAAGPTLG